MGYSPDSLKSIRDNLPERFDVEGGDALFQEFEDLEVSALDFCGAEMEEGLEATRNKFLKSYDLVPADSRLKTPEVERGINFDWLSRRDPVQIWNYLLSNEGKERLLFMAGVFEESVMDLLQGLQGFNFKRGPIKKEGALLNEFLRWSKYEQGRVEVGEVDTRIRFIRDIIRGRIEANTLKEVESVLVALASGFSDRVVSCFNTYQSLFPTRRDRSIPRPYLGCNFAFSASDDMPYELQVMTRRASLIGKITHRGLFSDNPIPLPVQENIETLAWASHFVDYSGYLGG